MRTYMLMVHDPHIRVQALMFEFQTLNETEIISTGLRLYTGARVSSSMNTITFSSAHSLEVIRRITATIVHNTPHSVVTDDGNVWFND